MFRTDPLCGCRQRPLLADSTPPTNNERRLLLITGDSTLARDTADSAHGTSIQIVLALAFFK